MAIKPPVKMSITVRDAHAMYIGLSTLRRLPVEQNNSAFAFAASMNRKHLTGIVTTLEELTKDIPKSVQTYYNEHRELCTRLAQKDDDGKPIMTGPNGYSLPNTPEVRNELDALNEKHKEAIELSKQKRDDLERLLTAMVEVRFIKVELTDLPPGVSAKTMDEISPMLDTEMFDTGVAKMPTLPDKN